MATERGDGMLGFVIGFIAGALAGMFCLCLLMAGRGEDDD